MIIKNILARSPVLDQQYLQPKKSWTSGCRSIVSKAHCRGALVVQAFATEVEPSLYLAQSNYASLPTHNRSNSVSQNRVLAGVRRKVPTPALVVADAATCFSIRAELESGLKRWSHLYELEDQVSTQGCSRIRLQCGTTLILPPGMAHCSPCTNADVRMGINRKVSSFVKTPPASRGSQVPLDTTHHGVHQASDSAGVSPVKVLVARPATVKIKAISRRVSLAVALAE